ncbi:SDR family NAD(P)-dependent oxidoreductase [Nocardia sp. CNY236]|uniref:SDR family NAD(P)-dependent oxidoreductase n=1 Tax=Nocardia sp. CNY236 TaxID=1169152 RepID=UPI0018C8E34A|nr:SDR family NAD(P)-dependent oxidoreductase [Nocardia sp. CNY236]
MSGRIDIRVDVLANNAAGAWWERIVTDDGNELTFQVNDLATFLLTNLLRERSTRSQARVINTASIAYRLADLNLDTVDTHTGPYSIFRAYAASKLADILFTRELARRTEGTGLVTAAFHPGATASRLYDDVPLGLGRFINSPIARPVFAGPAKGAAPLVYLATTADGSTINGRYFNRFDLERLRNTQAADPDLAQRLWRLSEHATGVEPA